MKESKYLIFSEINDTGKTKIFSVGNKTGDILGVIKWIGAWRKYGFYPAPECQFDSSCLKDITEFIDELMDKRKTIKTKLPGLEGVDIIEASPLLIKKIL